MNPPFWYLTILTGALPSSLVPGTGSAKGRANGSSAGALGGEYHGALFLSELVTISGKQWVQDSKEKKSRRNGQERQTTASRIDLIKVH